MNKYVAGLLVLHSMCAAQYKTTSNLSLSQDELMKIEQFYKNKKVIVTGGCGFIGSHLAQKLVELGAHVTIIDNLATGAVDNIKEFKNKVTFLEQSITNKQACDQAIENHEIIFHLAAFISVPGSVKDPDACHETNVDGTFNILHAAKKHHSKRVVFSSTSSVYGPRQDRCYETDTTLQPVSPYGATKLMGELYCKQFTLLYNVPCVMLRYFNVYGSRQNPHSQYAAVVAKFQYHMERNEPITIHGDGMQTRDFVSVDEVVQANLLVGMAPQELVGGQIYNIGTGTSISVLKLAEQMKKQYPSYTAATRFETARDGDVKHTQMSAEKYLKLKETIL